MYNCGWFRDILCTGSIVQMTLCCISLFNAEISHSTLKDIKYTLNIFSLLSKNCQSHEFPMMTSRVTYDCPINSPWKAIFALQFDDHSPSITIWHWDLSASCDCINMTSLVTEGETQMCYSFRAVRWVWVRWPSHIHD